MQKFLTNEDQLNLLYQQVLRKTLPILVKEQADTLTKIKTKFKNNSLIIDRLSDFLSINNKDTFNDFLEKHYFSLKTNINDEQKTNINDEQKTNSFICQEVSDLILEPFVS